VGKINFGKNKIHIFHNLWIVIAVLVILGGTATSPIWLNPSGKSPIKNPDTGISQKDDADKPDNGGTVVTDDEIGPGVAFNTENISRTLAKPNSQPIAAPSRQNLERRKISFNDKAAKVKINGQIFPLRRYKMLINSGDPNSGQWWSSGTSLNEAWGTTIGSTDTTIAIIDTGFALDHEEFSNRWYQNPGEVGAAGSENPSRLNCSDRSLSLNENCNLVDDDLDGVVDNESGSTSYENPSQLNCSDQSLPLTKDCNIVDDDGNNYVDDVTGWDFINVDNSAQAGHLNPNGDGTQHGTLVSGMAAATGDNGAGIAGVNWRTKILPLQALDDDGYGDTVSVGDAIFYAVEQEVDVISISLGSAFDDVYVRKAIEKATKAGITVVAASGNDGCDCIIYPARYAEVLAVGALNTSNEPASFSSWGSNLDILAPGTSITTPTWRSTNMTSAYRSGVNGTSLAAPYVSGLAALIIGQDPGIKPLQLIAALTETAKRGSEFSSTTHKNTYGFGVADAGSALSRVTTGKTAEYIYGLGRVYTGDYITPGSPKEASGDYLVTTCDKSLATTPIYELKKGSRRFFTASKPERRSAIQTGYTSTRFIYGCIAQNNDILSGIRLLNVVSEFKNSKAKP